MRTHLFILFCLFLVAWLSKGCDKSDENPIELPIVTIGMPGSITASSAAVEAAVTADGGSDVTARGICFSIETGPTINDNKTTDGSGTGSFSSILTGLISNTLYHIRAYATNSKGTGYSTELSFMTTFEAVSDYENNVYQSVKIGQQVWINENLKSTKYADGTEIIGAYPAGGNESNVSVFGRLYNWYAVMNGAESSDANPSMVQGVCPTGYHVPSDAEWKELEIFLGMSKEEADLETYRGDVAGKLKSPTFWQPAPILGDNSTGFSALPAGYRELDGKPHFDDYFWGGFYISTESTDTAKVAARLLTGDQNGIWRYADSKKYGYSVRCVKDE